MPAVTRHLSRCLLAGIVALLPIGGLVLTIVWMESAIASSWLAEQPYYVPGLGLVAVTVLVYLIGLLVTSFLGRWLWSRVDALIDALPAIGSFYQTLKQILGYGEGRDAVFQEVVMVPGRDPGTEELGLVTRRLEEGKLLVFVPGSPTPTTGRLVLVGADGVRKVSISVNDALTTLLTVGNTATGLA